MIFTLSKELIFPPVELAEKDGLLAIGGDLSAERLVLAYQLGIFPWFEGELPLWYSPDPRFVLFPDELRISNSMKQVIKSGKFQFTTDTVFRDVIENCGMVKREGQGGTWITDEMIEAYVQLHEMGFAHSAEVWLEGKLVGGLYGIITGNVFCGESMFSTKSNASKFALLQFVPKLVEKEINIIDCQVYTEHLFSLGARMIPRKDYLSFLQQK